MTLPDQDLNHLKAVRNAVRNLIVYRDLQGDPVIEDFTNLLGILCGDEEPDFPEVRRLFINVYSGLAQWAELSWTPVGDHVWGSYLLDKIATCENVFTLKAGLSSPRGMGSSLLKAVAADLRNLQILYGADEGAIHRVVQGKVSGGMNNTFTDDLPGWNSFKDLPPAGGYRDIVGLLKEIFRPSIPWDNQIKALADFYARHGSGMYCRYHALRWTRRRGRGKLLGISNPDTIRMENLIGYHGERAQVLDNTRKFIKGLPAHNLLLYGNRGTGKSSTVKALLPEYGQCGLRMVEVPKSCLGDFHEITSLLRERPQRFILFVDDLSFEEHEVGYKELKAVLEGGLTARPENVLIYATSNRRHLVRESFADRRSSGEGDAEVHPMDTLQEKLSLADRFGMTILFPAPDQILYLEIVEGLAKQMNIPLDREDLQKRAIQWERWHNGRSARTARQFIDHLAGELGMRPGHRQ